ncbi:MAG: tetratricopeptide repeat protein [Deltaproteobacteria bacterium]|nr:tetratricopeptide repeat protein [Deltaproteobacteria bacterium]
MNSRLSSIILSKLVLLSFLVFALFPQTPAIARQGTDFQGSQALKSRGGQQEEAVFHEPSIPGRVEAQGDDEEDEEDDEEDDEEETPLEPKPKPANKHAKKKHATKKKKVSEPDTESEDEDEDEEPVEEVRVPSSPREEKGNTKAFMPSATFGKETKKAPSIEPSPSNTTGNRNQATPPVNNKEGGGIEGIVEPSWATSPNRNIRKHPLKNKGRNNNLTPKPQGHVPLLESQPHGLKKPAKKDLSVAHGEVLLKTPLTPIGNKGLEKPVSKKNGSRQAGAGPGLKKHLLDDPKASMESLRSTFNDLVRAVEKDDKATVQGLLDPLVQGKNELGMHNFQALSDSLSTLSGLAGNSGHHDLALLLCETAAKVSPELPGPSFCKARALEATGVLGYLKSAVARLRGTGKMLSTLGPGSELIANLMIVVIAGLGFALLLASLMIIVRYIRLLLHDLGHLFLRGISSVQKSVILLFVLVVPIGIFAGPVILLVFMLALLSPYMKWSERVLVLLVALYIGTVPLSTMGIVHAVDLATGPETRLEKADIDNCDNRLKNEVLGILKTDPKEPAALFAAGMCFKRAGDYDKAEAYLSRAIDVLPAEMAFLVNMGNVMFINGDPASAEQYYRKAAQAMPTNPLPYYNLAKLSFFQANPEQGTDYQRRALRLNSDQVERYTRLDGSSVNRFVLDAELPRDVLLSGFRGRELYRSEIWHILWEDSLGDRSPVTFVLSGVFLIFAVFAMTLSRRWMEYSKICKRCGGPACIRCSGTIAQQSICAPCFHAYEQSEGVAAELKEERQRRVEKSRRIRRFLSMGLAVLIPGSGHFAVGRPVSGIVVSLPFGLMAAMELTPGVIFRSIIDGPALPGLGGLLLVIGSVLYIVSVVDAIRG